MKTIVEWYFRENGHIEEFDSISLIEWISDLSVARVGVEPTRSCDRQILSLLRLPVPPSRHVNISKIISDP